MKIFEEIDGQKVLTAEYLLSRGRCCFNGCKNCPYKDPCLVCGSPTQDIRGKIVCTKCGRINESCCEGGRC